MREPLVLLFGNVEDPHITSIAENLTSLSVRNYVFDAVSFDGVEASCVFDHSDNVTLRINGESVFGHDITSILWRPKLVLAEKEINYNFRYREWRHALEPLSDLLNNTRWINPRKTDQFVRYKVLQLYSAKKHGIKIPRTLISNDVYKIKEFCGGNFDRFVYKPLTYLYEYPNKILFTTLLSEELIDKYIDTINICPCIFQEKIDKKFELRITVVGREVFSAKIFSQEREDTKIDWRKNQFELRYEEYLIDDKLRESILQFHTDNKLVFGAYDFIMTPEGHPIFLEVNPSGQWLWIEEKLGLPISKAIAYELSNLYDR